MTHHEMLAVSTTALQAGASGLLAVRMRVELDPFDAVVVDQHVRSWSNGRGPGIFT